MAFIRFGSDYEPEVRLARLKSLQHGSAVLGITALVFVLLEGEGPVTASRLVWALIGVASLLVYKYTVRKERKPMS